MHECGGKWFPLFDIYILRFKAVIVQPGIFLSYSSFNLTSFFLVHMKHCKLRCVRSYANIEQYFAFANNALKVRVEFKK